ncbi:hypothetical protein PUMCH_002538 [Australozyma saopauloensis]|uniref:LNS2/PITP domain-containing protein n=1 Tax=Australozyma saopauloensis TaxID=291208 RepID=A0AAX4H9M2_9ASCO|nr:hypothetical protein PUMCH_002538 [[Candida] saopauloensis]
MQYVGQFGGYVYNQWNSLNPATLSGAIDILVIEQPDGTLQCSPWHVRFGVFQILKPLDKKIDVYVNDTKTDLPMKLGEGGEAFFVFETDSNDLSLSVVTSPVISAASSPQMSPSSGTLDMRSEPEDLDLNLNSPKGKDDIESKIRLSNSPPPSQRPGSPGSPRSEALRLTFEKVKKLTKKLNIPSKIDVNGDVILDMDGYKPSAEKNIALSDKMVHDIFLKEMYSSLEGSDLGASDEGKPGFTEYDLLQSVIKKDSDGRIRIINKEPELEMMDEALDSQDLTFAPEAEDNGDALPNSDPSKDKVYIKTLRLTSLQLANMKLQYGRNRLRFQLSHGTSQIESDLYLWKSTTPIVISDIDGTITKSDALGHVLNMFGKDWTHPGVANLFQDINKNGYNVLYLTARSAGQADTTRQYLDSINQDGMRLPKGPVILSPDRTMAALKREIILKKPEVFKMACLRDIKSLFFQNQGKDDDEDEEDDRTPFYAGFGNRITDAISYRSVKIPSHRIFTINPNGEVHMELLELAGYRSTYLRIGELVDQFFPPLKYITDFNGYWDQNQLDDYMSKKGSQDDGDESVSRPLVCPGSPRSINSTEHVFRADEKYTDLNYWRENMDYLSDLSDIEDDDSTEPKSTPGSPKLPGRSVASSPKFPASRARESSPPGMSLKSDRLSSSTFSSPLKSFMARSNYTNPAPKPMKSNIQIGQEADSANATFDDDDEYFTDDYDDDEPENYDQVLDDDEEDEDDDDDEDGDEEEDYDYTSDDDLEDPEIDDEDAEEDLDEEEDIDFEEQIPTEALPESAKHQNDEGKPTITTANEMLKNMKIE